MKRLKRLLAAFLMVMLLTTAVPVTSAFAATKVTATGNCNIRSGPSKSYSIRGVLKKGKKATYLNSYRTDYRGVIWYKVYYQGKTGWVSSMYTYVGSGAYYIWDDDDDYYYDDYYEYGDLVKTTARVNIRKSASKSSKRYGTVSKGTYLTYRGTAKRDSHGTLWYGVRYNGKNAWVSSMYSYIV